MQDTSTLPDTEIIGEIFTASDLAKAARSYFKQHGYEPYALVTGYMERRSTRERIYCDACYIADADAKWFTVCHPTGTYTMRVPEHEQITVTLTLNTED